MKNKDIKRGWWWGVMLAAWEESTNGK